MFQVPDKLYKLLIFLGIVLIGYSYLKSLERSEDYDSSRVKLDDLLDSVNIKKEFVAKDSINFDRATMRLTKFVKEDSLFFNLDDDIIFNVEHSEYSRFKDELIRLRSRKTRLHQLKQEYDLLQKKKERSYSRFKADRTLYRLWSDAYEILTDAGLILFIIGVLAWLIDSSGKGLTRQDEKIYRFCQSCGEAFNAVRINGKNKDGSTNNAFCVNCFKKGKFIEPELNVDMAIQRFKSRRGLFSGWWKSNVSNLDRWDKRNSTEKKIIEDK